MVLGPDDVAFLQYTGGTTGVAKGAMLTHGNMVANLQQVGEWIARDLEDGKEVAVIPLPLYHVFALTCSLVYMKKGARWSSSRTRVTFRRRRDAEESAVHDDDRRQHAV